jgi:hypothetical protein
MFDAHLHLPGRNDIERVERRWIWERQEHGIGLTDGLRGNSIRLGGSSMPAVVWMKSLRDALAGH